MFDRIDEWDAGATLDAVETWHTEQTRAEIATFVAAAHYADLHHPDTRGRRVGGGAGGRVLPGTEQDRRLGGAGTPVVREFAAAAFGARLGKSPYVGRCWLADALDVRHRLPRLWGRVRAGEVPVGYARHVAAATRELSQAAAGWVDGEVAPYADGRLGWTRFATLVAGKIVAADPEAAAAKERAAATDTFAKVGRSTEHGQKTLYVRTAAAAMVRIDATLAYLADALRALGDTDTEDARRAKAVLVMANPTQATRLLAAFAAHRRTTHDHHDGDHHDSEDPAPDEDPLPFHHHPDDSYHGGDQHGDHDGGDQGGDQGADRGGGEAETTAETGEPTRRFYARFRPGDHQPDPGADAPAGFTPGSTGFDTRDLLPPLTLYLHLSETTTRDGAGVVRWEGQSPVSTGYLTEILAPAARITVKPVLDPAGMAPVDAYEIPDAHREAVHLRTPADIFPYAAATTSRDGRTTQLDHTRPYRPPADGGPPGQTAPGNLGPMTGFHHRIKTHGGWQLKQPFPGLYLWRDPHGRLYLVDHTGTRPLGHSPPTNTDQPDITLHVSHFDDDPALPAVEYTGDRHAA